MKTDIYTKIVLTLIAASLLWSNLATPRTVAKAQDEQRVIISDIDLITGRGMPIHVTEPVEVKCK